jgi:ketosteroid isomerase-like protein
MTTPSKSTPSKATEGKASPTQTLINLENKFWQAMVDKDADTAVEMINEPSVMVSSHGAIKFDRAGYRKMAEQGQQVLTNFALSDLEVTFPNETTAVLTYRVKQEVASRDNGSESTSQEMNESSLWIKKGKQWLCALHTETPRAAKPGTH